ncbi:hypothetical protein [Streptomyces silvensis]|uniref:Uncharacterized protein n=1 Tax=Streptomyces silvensis TaxID=1765722 RepID=A0A0W7X3R9_9ACTN|nr:hypothetical protein [Streptomyces silvensis]KUF17558.1 hypothetical protein AT728_09035 [Streptomyces silvensis]
MAEVWEFAIGNEGRPAASRRKSPVLGQRAVRTPQGGGEQRAFAPCAYIVPERPAGSADPAPGTGRAPGPRLYEDPDGRTPLCSLDAPERVDGERHYTVRDGQGRPIGTIRRIAALKHSLKPSWRIEQPAPQLTSSRDSSAPPATVR